MIGFEGEEHWTIQKSTSIASKINSKRLDTLANQDENLNWELYHQDNKKKKNSFLNQPL